MNIQFRDLIENAPLAPGIYKMYDKNGDLLYVGKAKNLKNRLRQYIDITKLENHKQVMRSLVTRIEWEITRTETDALILEEQLIKQLKPKYNVMLTDGKMYPMLAITKHEYPRLLKFRGKPKQKNDIYGPYPSVYALNDTIKTIQKVCKIRTCSDTFMKNRARPCLLYQIGRCSAPCCIKQNSYAKNITLAQKILRGDIEPVIKELTEEMTILSKKMNFESAAIIRDKIITLTETIKRDTRQKEPYTSNLDWEKDINDLENWLNKKLTKIGVFDNSHLFTKNPVGAMITFGHNGFIKDNYRHFKLKEKHRAGNDIAMMEEFITRAITDITDLDLIIVDGGPAQWNIAKKVCGDKIPILGVTKGIVRNGDEHFIMPNGEENFDLDKTSNLFLLLRHVRDEAHRFVITFHRAIRAKHLTLSCLDEIEDLGPKRKKILLQHFGSVHNISNASLKSLKQITGIGNSVAEKIYAYFH